MKSIQAMYLLSGENITCGYDKLNILNSCNIGHDKLVLQYMLTGLQKIIEKPTKFLLVMEYCLIMKALEEEKHL